MIEDSGQCVDDCSKTDYYILYGNKCYKTCDKIKNTIVKKFKGVNGNEYYTCACASGLWHRDETENKILCNEEKNKTRIIVFFVNICDTKQIIKQIHYGNFRKV